MPHTHNTISSHFGYQMLAVLRAQIPEVVRGLTTSLLLRSSTPTCPDLVCSPTLSCPEVHRCPDCVCSGVSRSCPVAPDVSTSTHFVSHVVFLLVGIVIGAFFHRQLCKYRGRPSIFSRCFPNKEESDSSSSSDLIEKARRQTALAKRNGVLSR